MRYHLQNGHGWGWGSKSSVDLLQATLHQMVGAWMPGGWRPGEIPGHGDSRAHFLVRLLDLDNEDRQDSGHAHHVATCRVAASGLLVGQIGPTSV